MYKILNPFLRSQHYGLYFVPFRLFLTYIFIKDHDRDGLPYIHFISPYILYIEINECDGWYILQKIH